MDYIKSAVLILCCVFLFSCCSGSYTKNETILKAESLLYTAPDSAYGLLSSISHPENLSKADYAAWCLQYTHAQYKLYKDIKSDSIIRIAVDYYGHTKLLKQSGTAYYLLGCILISNSNTKDALLAFKVADDLLQNVEDNNLKGLVKYNIGYTYFKDEIFSQTLIYYKKSLQYFIASKNFKYQAYAYRGISDMYNQFDYPFDSIIRNSNLALQLSKQAGDSYNYYSILAQQGELLSDKDYSRSKEYLLKGFQYIPVLRPNYATLLAYVYSKLHQPDSAKFYLKIPAKDTLGISSNAIRYYIGAHIARDEGNLVQAYDFYKKAYTLRSISLKNSLKSQL